MSTWMAKFGLACAACAAPLAAAAQEPAPSPNGTIGVFLDCHDRFCDFDHFRREIPFVNWMRDRRDADVHVLITSQRTGGDGRAYTLAFIGLGDLSEQQDTLEYTSSGTDTEAEVRDGLTQTIALGLIPYVSDSPVARSIEISYRAPERALITSDTIYDPWNYWVFRIGVGADAEGESLQRFWAGDASVSANRTTDAFKVTLRGFWTGSRQEFDDTTDTGADTTIVGTRTFWTGDVLTVWSLSDHWSAGAMAELEHSSVRNTQLGLMAGPAIEYNIFPWRESTRKQLTFLYTIGVGAFNWIDTTLLGQTKETHPIHMLEIGTEVTQPWGSVNVSLEAFQYLHDLSYHRVELDGGFRIRIFRGLDFGVFGSIARVKDQIYLPAEGATDIDILLQLQQRGTDFFYGIGINLSYRFGSKFNNVVNPRMRGGF